VLTQKAKANLNWFVNAIFKYLQDHKARVDRKEISSSTLRNYLKPIRLYCDQMDIPIPWKKLMRGMPKGKRYANDRAPTLEEIKSILSYPDRNCIYNVLIRYTSKRLGLSEMEAHSSRTKNKNICKISMFV
jgi:integrase